MRFVAGRGAVVELLTGAVAELLLAWAPQWSTIGKILLAWALQRRAIGKMLLTSAAAELLTGRYAVAKRRAGAPQWRRGRQGTPQWQRGCWREALRQSRRRQRGIPVARERHSRLARERRGRLAGNAAADWQGNARNAKEPVPADGTGPSQTFGCIQAEQSLVEDFACLFLLGMRIYI